MKNIKMTDLQSSDRVADTVSENVKGGVSILIYPERKIVKPSTH